MRYHECNITLDDREHMALDVLHRPQESTQMTQAEARILLTTRFASLLLCIAGGQQSSGPLDGLPPKALERIQNAMERADEYDESGQHVGSPRIRDRIEYDETRNLTTILPLKMGGAK